MAKINLSEISNFNTNAITTLNKNKRQTEVAIDNTLSRDGSPPNQMEFEIDMNSHQIMNVPMPIDDHNAVNKKYVDELIHDLHLEDSDGSAFIPEGSRGITITGNKFKLTTEIDAEDGEDITVKLREVFEASSPDARSITLPAGTFYVTERMRYLGEPGKSVNGSRIGVTDLVWGTAAGGQATSWGLWFEPPADSAPSTKHVRDISFLTTAFPTAGVWPGDKIYDPIDGATVKDVFSEVLISVSSPAVITWINHNLFPNIGVSFVPDEGGSLPTGITQGVTYYVKIVGSPDTFTISATPGGAAINTTAAGSGIITGTAQTDLMFMPDVFPVAIAYKGDEDDLSERRTTRLYIERCEFRGVSPISPGTPDLGQFTPNGWRYGLKCLDIRDAYIQNCKFLGFQEAAARQSGPYFQANIDAHRSEAGIFVGNHSHARAGFRVDDCNFNFWQQPCTITNMEGGQIRNCAGSQNVSGFKWVNQVPRTAGNITGNFSACSLGPGVEVRRGIGITVADNKTNAVGTPLNKQFRGVNISDASQVTVRSNYTDNQRQNSAMANIVEPIGINSYEQSADKSEIIVAGSGISPIIDISRFTYTLGANELKVYLCRKTWITTATPPSLADAKLDDWIELPINPDPLPAIGYTEMAAPFADGRSRQITLQLGVDSAGSLIKVVKLTEAVIGVYLEGVAWANVDESNLASNSDVGIFVDALSIKNRIPRFRLFSPERAANILGTTNIVPLISAGGTLVTGLAPGIDEEDNRNYIVISPGADYHEILASINFGKDADGKSTAISSMKAGILANGHLHLHTHERPQASDITISVLSTPSLLIELGIDTFVGTTPGNEVPPWGKGRIVADSDNDITGNRLTIRKPIAATNQSVANTGLDSVSWGEEIAAENIASPSNTVFRVARKGLYIIEASVQFIGAGSIGGGALTNTWRGWRIERQVAPGASEFGLPKARVAVNPAAGDGDVIAKAFQVCSISRLENLQMKAEHNSNTNVDIVEGPNTYLSILYLGPMSEYPE